MTPSFPPVVVASIASAFSISAATSTSENEGAMRLSA